MGRPCGAGYVEGHISEPMAVSYTSGDLAGYTSDILCSVLMGRARTAGFQRGEGSLQCT